MPDIAERTGFFFPDQAVALRRRRLCHPVAQVRAAVQLARLPLRHRQGRDRRRALGPDLDVEIFPIDETNTRVRPHGIARQIAAAGGRGLVGFVGVQSNQFPRAMDVARPLRAAGVQVCIGGFHVSGCLAMLPETPDSLKEALDLGISLFAGEAEGRFDDVLSDAAAGTLKPIYNFLDNLPNLDGATAPYLPQDRVGRSIGMISSFDAGRGCPFLCSFCTIINVQGRKSRYRSADDIERIVRDEPRQRRPLLLHHRRQPRPEPQLGGDLRPADRAAARRA